MSQERQVPRVTHKFPLMQLLEQIDLNCSRVPNLPAGVLVAQ
jgi:hypothetical protein